MSQDIWRVGVTQIHVDLVGMSVNAKSTFMLGLDKSTGKKLSFVSDDSR